MYKKTIQKEIKPPIDHEFCEVIIHLKPWANKVNSLVSIISTDDNPVDFVHSTVKEIKNKKGYRRRTITGFSIRRNLHIKL